jgi:hypothetical protein
LAQAIKSTNDRAEQHKERRFDIANHFLHERNYGDSAVGGGKFFFETAGDGGDVRLGLRKRYAWFEPGKNAQMITAALLCAGAE